MQTISVPYNCEIEDRQFITLVQRKYSAAVRTAFANCVDANGKLKPEKEHRNFVKDRHAGGVVDAWALHCATLEARDLYASGQPQHMVFGGRRNLERRRKRLISAEEWRKFRLRPFCSRGDKFFFGNRHFKLTADGRSCTFSMMVPRVPGQRMEWVKVLLDLPTMTGNTGVLLRQIARLADRSEKAVRHNRSRRFACPPRTEDHRPMSWHRPQPRFDWL